MIQKADLFLYCILLACLFHGTNAVNLDNIREKVKEEVLEINRQRLIAMSPSPGKLKQHPIVTRHFEAFMANAFSPDPKVKLFDLDRWKPDMSPKPGEEEANVEKIVDSMKAFILHSLYVLVQVLPDGGGVAIDEVNLMALAHWFTSAQLASLAVIIPGVLPSDVVTHAKSSRKIRHQVFKTQKDATNVRQWNIRKDNYLERMVERLAQYVSSKTPEGERKPRYMLLESSLHELMGNEMKAKEKDLEAALSSMVYSDEECRHFHTHFFDDSIEVDLLSGLLHLLVTATDEVPLLQFKPFELHYKTGTFYDEEKVSTLLNYVFRSPLMAQAHVKRGDMAQRIILLFWHLLFKRQNEFMKDYLEPHRTTPDQFHFKDLPAKTLAHLILRSGMLIDLKPLMQLLVMTLRKHSDHAKHANEPCDKSTTPTLEQLNQAETARKTRLKAYVAKVAAAKKKIVQMAKKYDIKPDSMGIMRRLAHDYFGYTSYQAADAFADIWPTSIEGSIPTTTKLGQDESVAAEWLRNDSVGECYAHGYNHLALWYFKDAVGRWTISTQFYYGVGVRLMIRAAMAIYVEHHEYADPKFEDRMQATMDEHLPDSIELIKVFVNRQTSNEIEREEEVLSKVDEMMKRLEFLWGKHTEFANKPDVLLAPANKLLHPVESDEFHTIMGCISGVDINPQWLWYGQPRTLNTNLLKKVAKMFLIQHDFRSSLSSFLSSSIKMDREADEILFYPSNITVYQKDVELQDYFDETNGFLKNMFTNTITWFDAEVGKLSVLKARMIQILLMIKVLIYREDYYTARSKFVNESLPTDNCYLDEMKVNTALVSEIQQLVTFFNKFPPLNNNPPDPSNSRVTRGNKEENWIDHVKWPVIERYNQGSLQLPQYVLPANPIFNGLPR